MISILTSCYKIVKIPHRYAAVPVAANQILGGLYLFRVGWLFVHLMQTEYWHAIILKRSQQNFLKKLLNNWLTIVWIFVTVFLFLELLRVLVVNLQTSLVDTYLSVSFRPLCFLKLADNGLALKKY